MKGKSVLNALSLVVGLVSLYMLYLSGGFLLVSGIMLFGWSINLQNLARNIK